jgi:hypothetical protein
MTVVGARVGAHRHYEVWAVYTLGERQVEESRLSQHWTRRQARARAQMLNRDHSITIEMFKASAQGVPLGVECEIRNSSPCRAHAVEQLPSSQHPL